MRRFVLSLLVAAGCAGPSAADEPALVLEREVRLEKLLGPGKWEASGVELVAGRLVIVLDDDRRLVAVEPDLSKAELIGEDQGAAA